MRLTAIDVRDLRVLRQAALEAGPDINVIIGANAAGKTSLLEAIHVLATGRSFAASRTARLVRTGGGPLRVVGRVQAPDGGRLHRLGLERDTTGPARMRLDGGPAERVADLARLLPVIAIHPQSHDLIAGGPGERRRLLDLGLFHVEPEFHGLWQRYRRSLSQRNVLLRRRAGENEIQPWEVELARSGERIDTMRQRYVAALGADVQAMASTLLGGDAALELGYRRGWPDDESLSATLGRLRGRDLEQRVAGAGPQRADLRFRLDDRDVRQRVSRGQQKLLVYLVRLAQARQLARSGAGGCVLLLDDLPAELDRERRERVMTVAGSIGVQCFVTALDAESVPGTAGSERSVFHVEQGRVAEVI